GPAPREGPATLGLAETEKEALDRGHAVVFRTTPELRPQVEPALMATWNAVERLAALARQTDSPAPLEEAVLRHDEGVAAVWAHYDRAAAALEHQLRGRIGSLEAHRRLLLRLVAGGVAVAI